MFISRERHQVFALIQAFESDCRYQIEQKLLSRFDQEEILGAFLDEALRRQADERVAGGEDDSVVEFLDFQQAFEILRTHGSHLDPDIVVALGRHGEDIKFMSSLRNRIAHARALQVDDYVNCVRTCRELVSDGWFSGKLERTLREIENDPFWASSLAIPILEPPVINNIPQGDFDDTGLIGRQKVVSKLRKVLERAGAGGRERVFSLVAPGGMGKTAVAIEVLQDLVWDQSSPFEMIFWTSLKTERLTTFGTETIRDAIRDLSDSVPSLLRLLDDDAEPISLELLEGLNVLVVIDNLETVSAEEVLDFIDELPESFTFLFTSRRGLGELERVIKLEPLDERSCGNLLRAACLASGENTLAAASPDFVQDCVGKLNYSPLAIKWFVNAVASGLTTEAVLDRAGDVVEFSIGNVWAEISAQAKDIAVLVATLDRPLDASEIREHLTGASADSINKALSELLSRLLIERSVRESTSEAFSVIPMLADWIRGQKSNFDTRDVVARDGRIRESAQGIARTARRDPLNSMRIQGAEEFPVVAQKLSEAMRLIDQQEDRSGAKRLVDEQMNAAPNYWEAYRVAGYVYSKCGDFTRSEELFRQAADSAPDEYTKAIVEYQTAIHWMRGVKDSERAVPHARIAHGLLGSHKTASLLGNLLIHVGGFVEARELLLFASTSPNAVERMYAQTQLLELCRRVVQELSISDPDAAVGYLEDTVQKARVFCDSELIDDKFAKKAASMITNYLGRVGPSGRHGDEARRDRVLDAVSLAQQIGSRLVGGDLGRLVEEVERLVESADGELSRAATAFIASREDVVAQGRVCGTLYRWLPTGPYGFGDVEVMEDSLFIHIKSLRNKFDGFFLRPGVAFESGIVHDDLGRPRATDFFLIDVPSGPVEVRVTVERANEHQMAVVRDPESGALFSLPREHSDGMDLRAGDEVIVEVRRSHLPQEIEISRCTKVKGL